MRTIVQRAIAEPWAITAEGLELILSVAARENQTSVEALEAYRAEHVPTAERLTKRGPVAILTARGPMLRHANLFTAVSGATSYDVMRRDLQAALDDVSIRALALNLDTPGGEVSGVDELAKAIRAGKARKPIVAYVGGMAASAGYWLASQATEIVVAETAMLGSIGVRAVVQDTTEADAKAGRIEFISSQSPGKRADLSSDEGRGRIQRSIDALADVFIATVAEGRGVTADDVIAKFGGGDVLIGRAAVAAGMADRIGDFEAVVAELTGRAPSPKPVFRSTKMDEMIAKAEAEKLAAAARAEGLTAGATAERDRIKTILALDEAEDRQTLALHLALTTPTAVEDMKAVLAGLPTDAREPWQNQAFRQDPHGAVGGLVLFNPIESMSRSSAATAKAGWAKVFAAALNER